jgi:hypothetical protein
MIHTIPVNATIENMIKSLDETTFLAVGGGY